MEKRIKKQEKFSYFINDGRCYRYHSNKEKIIEIYNFFIHQFERCDDNIDLSLLSRVTFKDFKTYIKFVEDIKCYTALEKLMSVNKGYPKYLYETEKYYFGYFPFEPINLDDAIWAYLKETNKVERILRSPIDPSSETPIIKKYNQKDIYRIILKFVESEYKQSGPNRTYPIETDEERMQHELVYKLEKESYKKGKK